MLFAGLLLVAAGIVLPVGRFGLGGVKLAGGAVALVAFIPVFLTLRNAMPRGFNRTLAVLVGGFFFKLSVIIASVWIGVRALGLPTAEYAVACMSFLMSLQIFEALYFYRRRAQMTTEMGHQRV